MLESPNDINTEAAFYRKKILLSMIIPGIIVFIMWLVKVTEVLFELNLSMLGIYPMSGRGLIGVVTSPLIHSDFNHLFNNTLPLFFLATALFYFYAEVAWRVLGFTYLLTGMLVWVAGRDAWHIGASGLVYGLASFLFFSGILRKHFRLIALSLLIVFLYGSMVWGIFPGVYRHVSWESHMLGFISGILLALLYRKEGLQQPVYEWLDQMEEGDQEGGAEENKSGN